jgi:DDE superfamily endonuclease
LSIAINNVAAVDYKKRFVDIQAGWPGSVGDSRIWKNSYLNKIHKDWLEKFPTTSLPTGQVDGQIIYEEIPAFILADSAYANTKHVVTTFGTTECNSDPVIAALNKKLGGARYHVENAFGILKSRFQIFQRALQCSSEKVEPAIILTSSIFVMHNFLIDIKDTADWEAEVGHNAVSEEIEKLREFERLRDEAENEEDDEEDELRNDESSTRNILIRHMRWLLESHQRWQ